MRLALILAGVACAAVAIADPTPAEQAEVAKLERQLTEQRTQQRPLAAVAVARKLYALQRKQWGEDSPRAAYARDELARLLGELGEHGEELKLYEEGLRLAERKYGASSHKVAGVL